MQKWVTTYCASVVKSELEGMQRQHMKREPSGVAVTHVSAADIKPRVKR